MPGPSAAPRGDVASRPLSTAEEDGRRARRERNREAVVRALLDLYREGQLQPSTEAVAERAGLSPRSLFRYFDDADDLCRAAIACQHEAVRPLLALPVEPSAPLAERVAAVVEQRLRLFEAMGAVGQVSRLRAPFQPVIAEGLAQARSYLRHQVRRLFGPELAALGEPRAGRVLATVDVLLSFESHQLLRTDQRLGRARTAAALADALGALLVPQEAP